MFFNTPDFFIGVLATIFFVKIGQLILKEIGIKSIGWRQFSPFILFLVNFLFDYFLFKSAPVKLLYLLAFSSFIFVLLRCGQLIKPNQSRALIQFCAFALSILFLSIIKYKFVYNWHGWMHFGGTFLQLGIEDLGKTGIIGVSYFVFRMISFIADFDFKLTKYSYLSYINFLFFFPSFMSGPLDRFHRFAPEVRNFGNLSNFWQGCERIFWGIFKKIVLVSLATRFTGVIYDPKLYNVASFPSIAAGIVGFSFSLYFDFSGYTDIAIGTSLLFGIRIPENFLFPYSSKSIQEFWTRWHISLSEWIRDYLFYPLNRLGLERAAFLTPLGIMSIASLIAFTLSGIWHGDAVHYLLWGFGHGFALAFCGIYRFIMRKMLKKKYKILQSKPWYSLLSWVITMTYIFTVNLFFALDERSAFQLIVTALKKIV